MTNQDGAAVPKKDEVALKIYELLCTNIRTTDEISFKLLQIVPILSGTGVSLLVILEKQTLIGPIATTLISLVAALLTFGLFRWELRNIDECSRYIKHAKDLEKSQFRLEQFGLGQSLFQGRGSGLPFRPIFGGRKLKDIDKPRTEANLYAWSEHPIGKREAEQIVYITAIFAWFIPIIITIGRAIIL